jgi:iron complex outermembrane receptor protein
MCLSIFVAPQVLAQDQAADAPQGTTEEGVLEEVIVTGTRQLIKDSISIKRDNVMVVDGLSASDIGEIPALSIGEALESLTGVASHRENGGATEVSIRGLGPFLSATTFNGREATNGSGDRSVNFSQFPSELMNKIIVYKTQDATLIEGGVAGVIALETLRPLNYGKRRFQFDLKGN